MKAILRYTDCGGDQGVVFNILANKNTKVLRTRQGISIYPTITLLVKDFNELNELVSVLNRDTTYGVRILKVKREITFPKFLKDLFY